MYNIIINTKVNPERFADFLYKLSNQEHETTKYLNWLNTHPDSRERASYIIEHNKDKKTLYKPILTDEMWNKLQKELKN